MNPENLTTREAYVQGPAVTERYVKSLKGSIIIIYLTFYTNVL